MRLPAAWSSPAPWQSSAWPRAAASSQSCTWPRAPACGAADLPKKEKSATGLTAGLAATLTSGAIAALGFGFLPKRELRAAKGANFASAVGFAASGCFTGAAGVASAGSCTGGSFFVAGGVGAAGLGTGAGLATRSVAALGLPTNREPEASRGFTLAGTAGGAANGFFAAAVSSLCVAYGFLTAPRDGWYSLAGAAASVEGALVLKVAEGVCSAHVLFAGAR